MYGYLLLLILAAEATLAGGVTTRSTSTTVSLSATLSVTNTPSFSSGPGNVGLSRTDSFSLSETSTKTPTTTTPRNVSGGGASRTATFPTLSLSPRTTTATATATDGFRHNRTRVPPTPPPSPGNGSMCPHCSRTASYSLTLSASPSLSVTTTTMRRQVRTPPFGENVTLTGSSTLSRRSHSQPRGLEPPPHLEGTQSSSHRASLSVSQLPQPAQTRQIPVNHSAAVSPERPHVSLSPTLSPPPALSLSRTMETNGTAAPNGTTTGAPTTTAVPTVPNGTTAAPTHVPTLHPARRTLTRTVTFLEHAEAGPNGAGAAATEPRFFGSGAGETIVAVAGAAVIVLAVVLGIFAYRRWRRRRRSGDAAEPLVAPLRERTKTYRWYEDAEAVAQDIERRGDDSRLNAVETGDVPLVVATAPASASSTVAGAITDPFAPVATEGFLGGDFSAPRRPDGATRHVPRNPMVSAFDAMMMEELDDDSL